MQTHQMAKIEDNDNHDRRERWEVRGSVNGEKKNMSMLGKNIHMEKQMGLFFHFTKVQI